MPTQTYQSGFIAGEMKCNDAIALEMPRIAGEETDCGDEITEMLQEDPDLDVGEFRRGFVDGWDAQLAHWDRAEEA